VEKLGILEVSGSARKYAEVSRGALRPILERRDEEE
jgi:hypothetical protein